MSKFNKFCKIFFSCLGVLFILVWIVIWIFISDYEKNVAINIVEEIVKEYQTADGKALLSHLDIETNKYEDAQQFSNYIEEYIGDEKVNYAMVTSGSFENPQYIISKNNEVFEKIVLEPIGKSLLGYKKWKIQSETVSFNPLYSVTINAPSNAKIEINGISLSDKPTEEKMVLGLYENTPEGAFIPYFNTYTIDGFFLEPEIRAVGANGEECIVNKDEKSGTIYITTPATDEQYQIITKLTESFSASYYQYISGEAGFEVLSKYLYENSDFYEFIKKQNVKEFIGHNSSDLNSIKVNNCQSYDETQISCDVSFKFEYSINGEEYEYPSAYEINFIKDGENYKVVNLVAK